VAEDLFIYLFIRCWKEILR